MLLHVCPVCGYNELPELPEDYSICPCCFTEFGVNDVDWGIDLLRSEWIKSGAKWNSVYVLKPEPFNPIQQLLNVEYHASDDDKIAIESQSDREIYLIEVNFSKLPTPRFFNQKDSAVKVVPALQIANNFSWQLA